MAKRYTKRQVCGLSKWKTFAEDKINVAEKMKLSLERVKKHCREKKKTLVTSIFTFSPQCFEKDSFFGSLKLGIVL